MVGSGDQQIACAGYMPWCVDPSTLILEAGGNVESGMLLDVCACVLRINMQGAFASPEVAGGGFLRWVTVNARFTPQADGQSTRT
jgi:hypothetical protein